MVHHFEQVYLQLKYLLGMALMLAAFQVEGEPMTCSYTTYKWNTIDKKAVDFNTLSHPYSQLSNEHVDPQTGCTVCQEDQVSLSVGSIPSFRICKKIADEVLEILNELQARQVPLKKIVGYRVGKTRGKVDQEGNRTVFSNHSFGSAIDINPDDNGLYDHCIEIGPDCRLIKGGVWNPENPASLTAGGDVVEAFKGMGFRWGGEIPGKQKDFMHFSPTGY